MKILRIAAIAFGTYVALGLVLDAAIGYFQPRTETTAVLRTFDASGEPKETVLGLLEDDGQLWVESGHWFRGWYHRAVANPDVELVLDGQTHPYRAVPVDTDEAIETVTRLMGKGRGAGYWVGRAMLLWAPIKPVRLDPRTPSPS
jgi:F420H(2)-dependent quinone reductase